MSGTYHDDKALTLNRKNINGLVAKPLYGFGLTLKPALASMQSLEYSGWSPSGQNSGHFRPLAAYTVTSLDIPEATIMAKNHDCVAAGAAQDIEMPSQAAANGHTQLERVFTIKTGSRGPKTVVVDTANKTPISVVALSGSGPGGAAAYTAE